MDDIRVLLEQIEEQMQIIGKALADIKKLSTTLTKEADKQQKGVG